MFDAVADAQGSTVVPVRFFPTARPVRIGRENPDFTNNGRSRAIEFFLAAGGSAAGFFARGVFAGFVGAGSTVA